MSIPSTNSKCNDGGNCNYGEFARTRHNGLNNLYLTVFIHSWEFKSEDYDIGFGVLYKDKIGNVTWLVPVKRVDSHVVAEDGSITCDRVGKCKATIISINPLFTDLLKYRFFVV